MEGLQNKRSLGAVYSRNEYVDHLKNDISECDRIIDQSTGEHDKLNCLVENLGSLKIYPEHEALLPLGKNIFVKGRIIHTGECHVKKVGFPDPYVILQGIDQTIISLRNQMKLKQSDIETAKYAKYQMEERKTLLKGEDSAQNEGSSDPKEIYSEKGVAIKVGDYYEILEYED